MENSLLDILWIVVASGLVFFMQAGFAMVESGLSRSKNSINVAIKNLSDLGISILVFWIAGFALMFGTSKSGFFGTNNFFFESKATWGGVFFLFQAMFCSTSATIVSGAVAERMKYSSYIISTLFLSLIIYPIFGHWVWGGAFDGGAQGWLGKIGFVDFAGSTVVHSLGGWVSLSILLIIGSRSGRYNSDGKKNTINGSNIPMVVLGVIILWFGWFGFNGGSTMAMNDKVPGIILRTTLAAAAGMVGTLFLGWFIRKKPDATLVMNGSLAGLVAITAGVHAFTSLDSVLVGLIGGFVMLGCEILLDKLKIDDAVGAIPVHLAAGIWGTIAVGIFGDSELLGTGLSFLRQIKAQIIGVVACGAWTLIITYPIFKIWHMINPLRVSSEDEYKGLNVAEHGATTEILDLYTTMEKQSITGDLGLRAPVEPFTEVGQIATMYNKVIDSLEKNTIEKGAYLDILQNITDGMFLVNKDLSIGPYYSKALETIVGRDRVSGKTVKEVLIPHIQENIGEVLDEFFNLCFDINVKWRNCIKLNPLKDIEFTLTDASGLTVTKHLSFDFKRIEKNNNIKQLLVIVRDETIKKQLSQEMENEKKANRSEMELLYKILHIEPSVMTEFLENLEYELNEINIEFQNDDGNLKEKIESGFRHTHTIKGEAQLLQIDFISTKADELENKISQLRNKNNIEPSDFLTLTLSFSELQKTAENIKNLLEKWLSLEKIKIRNTHELFKENTENLIKKLSDRYEKDINLTMEYNIPNDFDKNKHKKIKDIIIQLVRNSVFHGIEKPEHRVEIGKKRTGNISIKTSSDNDNYVIKVRDDGNGIDKKRLFEIGVERGMIPQETKEITDKDIVKLLFASGVSTALKPDETAGKGVGMKLVKTLTKELNGKIKLKSKQGEFCEFSIIIPNKP